MAEKPIGCAIMEHVQLRLEKKKNETNNGKRKKTKCKAHIKKKRNENVHMVVCRKNALVRIFSIASVILNVSKIGIIFII